MPIFLTTTTDQVKSKNYSLLWKINVATGTIIAIAFATLFLFVRNILKKEFIAIAIIGIASVIDLWQVDNRYISKDNYNKPSELEIQSTPALEQIKAEVPSVKYYIGVNKNEDDKASLSYTIWR